MGLTIVECVGWAGVAKINCNTLGEVNMSARLQARLQGCKAVLGFYTKRSQSIGSVSIRLVATMAMLMPTVLTALVREGGYL